MASRGRIIHYSFVLCISLILLVSLADVAGCSFFKNWYYPQPYSYRIDTFPELKSYSAPGLVVTDSNAGQYIVTTPGTSINISLMETDPYQDWIPVEVGNATYTRNDLIDSYPVRHIFGLRANDSSVVRFNLVDSHTGKTAKIFEFYLVVDGKTSGIGWPTFSADLVPSFVWPLQLIF